MLVEAPRALEVVYIMPSLLFPHLPSLLVSQEKAKNKKLQILLGETRVFDYVLICLKKIKALISIEENINWKCN